jgi:hypothetical protein
MNLSPRLRRWLIIAAVCLGLFTLVGFFVLPPIIKAQAEKRLTAELGRTVTIGKVRVNPYALSLTLENFDIREKDGRSSFLGWNRLYVNFDALSSLAGDWVLGKIDLEGFHAGVVIHPDGSFNFSDLLTKFTPPPGAPAGPAAKAGRPIRVSSLKVTSARVDFADGSRKKPFATVLGPLTFNLTEFRTVGSRGAPYHFEAATESGEKLTWTGTLSADPLGSAGEFSLEHILLPKYAPYYADFTQTDLVAGEMSVHGHYEINLMAGRQVLKLTDGGVQVRGLKLLERANQRTAVELPALEVAGINADALALKASIGSITVSGGLVHVRREKDGSLNLLAMLQPAAASPPVTALANPAGPAAPAKRPDVLVAALTVKDFQIDVTDLAAPRPAQLGLGGLQFSAKNLTLAPGAGMPIELAFTWAPQGTVHVAGRVTLKPDLTADLKTDVTALEILPLSPYLEEFVNARITQGSVTTSNTVHLTMTGGQPAVTLAGDISVQKFGLVDSAHNEDLAGFAGLTLTGLKVATAPQLTVSLAEIAVAAPYARVLITADKSTPYSQVLAEAEQHVNLLGVLKPQASAPLPAATAPGAVAALPQIEIGRVTITDGDFSFVDRAIEPNVRMAITQFGGTIAGLSSANLAKADVDLKGVVDGAGPVAITGKLDPLGANTFVDLKVDFKNVDLLPLSPYAGRFAGYELARGKLIVDTKISVDGKKLDATNVVTLNQFTFGAATNSPDATGLPVRLGVALLKDIDGKIVIDLPVQGTLGDPNFRIGKVVMRVIVNLLTKAATSPFSLLGSMFGGGGEELAFQEFAPGGSELQPVDLPKLGTLIKALTNRPGLSLGIEGGYDAAADTYALKRLKLADLVRRQIWEAWHATDPNILPPAQLAITPEEYAAQVKKLFDGKFPPGTQFGAPLAAAPKVAAAPLPPPPGVVRRVINWVTFKSQRDARAAKQASDRQAAEQAKAAMATAAVPGLSLDEMTGRLAETMAVDENDLRALAAARAQRVRDYLMANGHIAADRLFLAQGQEAAKQNRGPRVFLSLQ